MTVTALAVVGAVVQPAAADRRSESNLSVRAPVDWERCYVRTGTFQCATLMVPLDHDDPNGRKIPIALIRQRATNPARRIGALMVNPGGPGGSGVDFVRFAGPFLFTDEVRERFDIVGFDPRGVARSRPLRCFEDSSEWGPYFTPFAFPRTEDEIDQWIASDRYLIDACEDRAGLIIDHMATADVARDMDRIRQALGEPKLDYVGYSYGSYLGVTYANMFPNRFRSIVVDGVLDPIQWSTGDATTSALPFSARLGSDIGTNDTAEEFFRLCDAAGKQRCAFAPHSERRYRALVRRLLDAPIEITDPEGGTFEYVYSFLIADTTGAMYSSFAWPGFAEFLAELEANADPSAIGAARARLHDRLGIGSPTFDRYENLVEAFPGVACTDSDNPDRYRAWVSAADSGGRESGYYLPLWTWFSSPCAIWPGFDADRYMGPFTRSTAEPVLVIGNRYDPATPYSGAETVSDLVPNSRLLTVRAWGHTSGGLSRCADEVVARYLVDGELPTSGTVCPQDFKPFPRPEDDQRRSAASEVARTITAINLAANGGGR